VKSLANLRGVYDDPKNYAVNFKSALSNFKVKEKPLKVFNDEFGPMCSG